MAMSSTHETIVLSGLSPFAISAGGDCANACDDGEALHNALKACAALGLAEGVANAALDGAFGLVDVKHPPELHA